MLRTPTYVILTGMLAFELVACQRQVCTSLECVDGNEEVVEPAEQGDASLACSDLDLTGVGTTPGESRVTSESGNRCYQFDLAENAVLEVRSNSPGSAVPGLQIESEQTGGPLAEDSFLVGVLDGTLSRPVPKGRYTMFLDDMWREPFDISVVATYQSQPSPEIDTSDEPGDREGTLLLNPNPTVVVQDFVGDPEDVDYYRVEFTQSMHVTLSFTRIAGMKEGRITALLVGERQDGSVDDASALVASEGFWNGSWFPDERIVHCRSCIVKVAATGPALYSIELTATPVAAAAN